VNEQASGVVGQGLTGGNLIGWALLMVKEPRRFFASLARTGGFGTPAGYALFWLFVSAVLELVVGRLRPQPIRFGWGVEIGWLIAGPFILVGIGFIVSAVLFVIWHLMGSKENYETAFRVWAFTTPVAVAGAVLGIVPFLNTLALLYGLFLLVMASVETHRLSPQKSWTVWGILAALLFALVAASVIARTALQRQGINVGPGAGLPGAPQGAGADRLQEVAEQLRRQMEQQQGAQPAEGN
jgi:hypothetical protein